MAKNQFWLKQQKSVFAQKRELNGNLVNSAYNMLSTIDVSFDPPQCGQPPLLRVHKKAEKVFWREHLAVFWTLIASPPLAIKSSDHKIMSCPEVLYNSCFGSDVLKWPHNPLHRCAPIGLMLKNSYFSICPPWSCDRELKFNFLQLLTPLDQYSKFGRSGPKGG